MEAERTAQLYTLKCAVPDCAVWLREGDWHYALGGRGQVKTCVGCATRRPLRYRGVDGRLVEEPRGWDRVDQAPYQQLRRPVQQQPNVRL